MDVPLTTLHDAAVAAGGRVNDAFLAVMIDAMRKYHDKQGASLDHVRITVPVSIRTDGDGIGGNRITLTRMKLPADISAPAVRIRAVRDIVAAWRKEPALAYTQEMAFGLNLLPRAYLGGVFKRVEMLASNVPGVPRQVWLAGARVVGYYAFGPTIGAAVNATLMSYAGVCNVGVNIDTGAIEDPQLFLECLNDAFRDVLALAGTPPPAQAPPAESPATETRSGRSVSERRGRPRGRREARPT
jgi:diacylglycerol O-acyltransferase